MSAALPADSLRLSSPVDRIRQDNHTVRVSHAGGEVVAQRAIVTLPPALAGGLAYEPAMTGHRDALTQSFPMGSVIKFQLQYDEPWWRADGLSGQVISFDDPIATTFDNSPADGDGGVLLAFAEGEHARRLGRLGLGERRETVTACLERYFPPRVPDFREYAEDSTGAQGVRAWLLTAGIRASVS